MADPLSLTGENLPASNVPKISLVSIVVPFLDEAETIQTLYDEIRAVADTLDVKTEVIFVNDGSTDGSGEVADDIARRNDDVVSICFRRNFGKAAALSAGMGRASGDVIITMDADLQDDPKELPRFLEAIAAGADVVSGWKQIRNDPIDKTLPSRVFNAVTSRAFNIKLHDINCGFKAYKRETLAHLNLYGELHRFTPALLNAAGFKVAEIRIDHRAREFGSSKYGWSRFIKGLLDLMTVYLLTRYGSRPSHFFALVGLPLLGLGGAFVAYLSVLWVLGMGPIGTRPLLQIGILFIVTGVQFLGVGLIAELVLASKLKETDKYVTSSIVKRSGDP